MFEKQFMGNDLQKALLAQRSLVSLRSEKVKVFPKRRE